MRLGVPATPDVLGIVRLVTSGLANVCGFALDGIEDLRIAVNELCVLIMGDAHPGTVQLRFVLNPGELEVHGECLPIGDRPPPAELTPLSAQILSVVTDDFEYDGSRFGLVKRLIGFDPVSAEVSEVGY